MAPMGGRPTLLACAALVAATVEGLGQQPSTSTTVRANPAVVLTADCSRAATGGGPGGRPSPDAIKICQAAVAAADAASTEATYERQGSRTYLADSYMFAQRWSEAIPMYRAAMDIAIKSGRSDTTRYLRGIAAAQANLGDLSAADQTAGSAVSQKEKLLAGASSPDDRTIHSIELRSIYALATQIKRLRGDVAGAATLEARAAALAKPR
jgi:hypothetical protein